MPTITNLYTNPSFETATTGTTKTPLSTNSSGRTSGDGYAGAYAITPAANGYVGAYGFITRNMMVAVTAGQTVYLHHAVKTAVGTTVVVTLERFNSGATYITDSSIETISGTGAWVSSSPSFVVPAGTFFISHKFVSSNAADFKVDALMIANGNPVGYFDGSTNGGSWTGTAHASTSTKFVAAAVTRRFPVLQVGSPHVGPLRVGKD